MSGLPSSRPTCYGPAGGPCGAVTNEARSHHFGLGAEPSLGEIGRIAKHYPVFRIVEDGHRPTDTRLPPSRRHSLP